MDGHRWHLRASWLPLLTVLPTRGWRLPLLAAMLTHPDRMMDRLLDDRDPFDLRDAERIAEQLVAAVTGWEWWAAQRLAATARADWTRIHGDLLRAGVDLARMAARAPASGFAVLYSYLVRDAEPRAVARLDAELAMPPPGVRAASTAWARMEASAFAAAEAGVQADSLGDGDTYRT